MKKTKITDELVREYLRNGYHVHIRTPDEHGNKRITETILLIAISSTQIKQATRVQFGLGGGEIPVVSRAFLSPRDTPNHRVPNKVVVGRIVRLVVDGCGYHRDIRVCNDEDEFQDWLVMPSMDDSGGRGIRKIAILNYPDMDMMKIKKDISRYRDYMEEK